MTFQIYQVVNGFMAGEFAPDEYRALTCAGDQQPDGWYYLLESMDDGNGPFRTKEAAESEAKSLLDELREEELKKAIVDRAERAFRVPEAMADQIGGLAVAEIRRVDPTQVDIYLVDKDGTTKRFYLIIE